jgi:hypothetical protein
LARLGFESGAHALQATTPQNLTRADDDQSDDGIMGDNRSRTLLVAQNKCSQAESHRMLREKALGLQDLDLG